MERNKLLNLASTACTVLSALQIAGITIITIILVHWHFDKEFYRQVQVTGKGTINLEVETTETTGKPAPGVTIREAEGTRPVKATVADLTPASLYFFYVQSVVIMIFVYLIFKEFGSVVRSVSALQTFRTDNIQSFRKIGKYLLVIFLASGFHFISTNTGDTSSANFSIDFDGTPLVLMLVAYVLAEIFKEGNRLYEEEQLTV